MNPKTVDYVKCEGSSGTCHHFRDKCHHVGVHIRGLKCGPVECEIAKRIVDCKKVDEHGIIMEVTA